MDTCLRRLCIQYLSYFMHKRNKTSAAADKWPKTTQPMNFTPKYSHDILPKEGGKTFNDMYSWAEQLGIIL